MSLPASLRDRLSQNIEAAKTNRLMAVVDEFRRDWMTLRNVKVRIVGNKEEGFSIRWDYSDQFGPDVEILKCLEETLKVGSTEKTNFGLLAANRIIRNEGKRVWVWRTDNQVINVIHTIFPKNTAQAICGEWKSRKFADEFERAENSKLT